MIAKKVNKETQEIQESKYSKLIIQDSYDNIEDSDNIEDCNLNNLFTSSESSNYKQISNNQLSNKQISNNQLSNKQISNNQIQNATTCIDVFDNTVNIFDNNDIDFIDDDNNYELITKSSITPPKSPKVSKNRKQKIDDNSDIISNMLKKNDKNINGWDNDANITIVNWYKTFKQQSFIYQFVLDRNIKISDRLAIISIISSGLLGIFSGFKLWIDNDSIFQTVSNILLMLLNFLVALITSASKRYIDDKRNETIRLYVEEVDIFIGELSAQVLNSPVYRMNADKFFKLNNNKYTKLISFAPNLSINEINEGKKNFIMYKEHCYYNI
jgi:hypothetical protein